MRSIDPGSSGSRISFTNISKNEGGSVNGRFSRKTFLYFEAARRNRKNLKWFKRNESLWREEVKHPFSTLLNKIEIDTHDNFKGIRFHPRMISLPVYRTENIPEDGTVVKPFTWAFLSEKRTSLYEWNPGINIYIGSEVSFGLGLYHPSGRQMKLLREVIQKDPSLLSTELRNKKFRTVWGDLAGEKYKRFPRGLVPDSLGAEFLWNKQFYVNRSYTKREIVSPGFAERVSADLNAGAGFLSWAREAVGVYEREIRS